MHVVVIRNPLILLYNFVLLIYFDLNRIGLAYIGRVGSAAVTVTLSIERYLAVTQCTSEISNKLLFWVPIIFSVFYNIPKFFELASCTSSEGSILQSNSNVTKLNFTDEIKNNISVPGGIQNDSIGLFYVDSINSSATNNSLDNGTMTTQNCDRDGMRATILRQNEFYVIFYVVISKVVLVEIIPWLVVIIMNILTWRKMRLFQKRREAMLKNHNSGNTLLQFYYDNIGLKEMNIFIK